MSTERTMRPRSLRCDCGAHLIWYWVEAGTVPTLHIDSAALSAAKNAHHCDAKEA